MVIRKWPSFHEIIGIQTKKDCKKHMSWAKDKFLFQEEKSLSEMLNFDQWRKGPIDVGAIPYRLNAHNKIL
jgi:hypothetical protein